MFREMLLENCNCKGAKIGVKIAGLPGRPHTIQNITFKNCNIVADTEQELSDCETILFE